MGVVKKEEAQQLAKSKSLDLILITDKTTPPVCKIMDIGEFKYHQKKKEKTKKTINTLKELKMRPSISSNDYTVRLEKAKAFLKKNYKVKLTIFFKGREIVHQNLGLDLIKKFVDEVNEYGKTLDTPTLKGRFITTIINPK